jgi:hypothetical protein
MNGKKVTGIAGISLLAVTLLTAQGPTSFQVSNVGFSAYTIDGVSNPTLTLYRGVTYTFQVSTPGHPFWIKTMQTTGTGNPYSSGVTGNGSTTGDVVFTVPMNAPDQLYYICEFHSSMTGVFCSRSAVLHLRVPFQHDRGISDRDGGIENGRRPGIPKGNRAIIQLSQSFQSGHDHPIRAAPGGGRSIGDL